MKSIEEDVKNRKYLVKLINGDYLSVGALTDVQLIYKNVPYEKAQRFEHKYAKYHYDALLELSKLENWELYYPVGIEEEMNNEYQGRERIFTE